MFNRFFESFVSVLGGGGEDGDMGGGDYDGYRQQVDMPEFGGMFWDATAARTHEADRQARLRTLNAYHVANAGAGWAPSETEPIKSTFNHIMTHRKEFPRPGFSYDFDPDGTSASAPIVIDDEPGPSGSSSVAVKASTPPPSSTLVCPRCSSTLLSGSRTMWALRCGHVLCDNCLQDISFPQSTKAIIADGEGDVLDVKGKGKARAVEDDVKVDASTNASSSAPPTKRSRRAVGLVASSSTRQLRSRPSATQTDIATSHLKPKATSRKRGRATKPSTVLEEWEYACPVEDCHRSHWAAKVWEVKLGGVIGEMETGAYVWRQKERFGAIPIFT
ncbi:hypothetical protein FRB95_002538 [Tulasnella sp. JGI-2019a]|nr:hypothetical protein FRB95_002538 [Tulasnella sp. JGI-2019a]